MFFSRHLPVENKKVLITGCDSGFGHALAVTLDGLGVSVYACCLSENSDGAKNLRDFCSERLTVIKLDLTIPQDIEDMRQRVYKDTQEDGLWGLVNNAGVWFAAELDMMPDEFMLTLLDINLVAVTRVTRALLPLIRKSKGRIVNVSSIAGMARFAGCGAYNMSKAAIDAYSDTLRVEMKKWGVHVSIVQPAGFITGNLDESLLRKRADAIWDAVDNATKEIYGRSYLDAYYTGLLKMSQQFPTDLTPVVNALRNGLFARRPRDRYPCGRGAGTIAFLYPLLPTCVKDFIVYAMQLLPYSMKPAILQTCSM